MREVERDIDRLFGLPLDEFTSARNELARRLKNEGDADAAEEVRALGKPSVSAWTINQLSRHQSGAIQELLGAGDAVRTAQTRLLREAGKPDALRDALAKERKAIDSLTEQARSVLEQAGRPATEAMLQRIAATLHAAAVEDEGRGLLAAGRLTGDLEPSGFDAFAGMELPQRSGSTGDELSDRRRKREEHRQLVREAEQQLRELEETAREAERDAKRAADAAAEAQRVAEGARRAADDAAMELTELRTSDPPAGRRRHA